MIVARVRRTLRERSLLRGGERVLVACSGGPDSAALLHALTRLAGELELTLDAASVDHGLRPNAGRDVETAAELADRLGVAFARLQVDVDPDRASVQAAAREARYAALLAHAAERGASHLAVGHTQDDQAETVLWRLLRGATVAGLGGVRPARADGVIRPLLDCRRTDVRAHVRRFELPFVDDPSNVDPRFTRARVRQELMPRLENENPALGAQLAALADEAREIASWVDAEAAAILAGATADELPVASLAAAPPPVRRAALAGWAESITGGPAKAAHRRALDDLRPGGVVLIGGGWVVRIEGDQLVARREPHHPTRSGSSHWPNME